MKVMTKIFLFKKKDHIFACQVKGHSGYAENGNDIVCAAVSTAVQMALVGLDEVLHLKLEQKTSDGFLSFKILEGFEDERAQVLLSAMEKTLQKLAMEYGKFVKMEVRKDDIV